MTTGYHSHNGAEAVYAYAIIPAADQLRFDVAGVDDEHDEVYSIPYKGLGAVVSASVRPDYRGLNRQEAARFLVAHQRVVESVMRLYPLLPMRFGTVLPGEAWVDRMLVQAETLFRTTLEKFANLVQMEVVILWHLPEVLQAISQEEEIASIRVRAAAHPEEVTEADRISVGRLVQLSLERRRAALRQHLASSLRDILLDGMVNPLMDDSMAVNVALLIERAHHERLYQRLDELDEEYEGKLTFRCVGPLPPYSFASVDVQVPSFEQVRDARCLLGLGETCRAAEIRRAYRQLASRLHPDHNPQDSQSEARMAELTRAHKLLAAYAESQAFETSLCHLDQPSVEQTLLISVQRQDAMAQGAL
jgi:hypothetical protein